MTNTKTTTVKNKKTTTVQKKEKKAYIYLGPNMKGGILNTNTVFKEIPKHLEDTFKKCPSVKNLFIEIKEASKFKSDLKNKSSVAFRLYNKVVNEMKEVK